MCEGPPPPPPVVVGCVEQEVGSSEEALGWLEAGNAARITGTTQMNQRSSRSHAIYTVHIGTSQLHLHMQGFVQDSCLLF